MYTGNSNGRNTFPERAARQTAERPGELVFNVLWLYVESWTDRFSYIARTSSRRSTNQVENRERTRTVRYRSLGSCENLIRTRRTHHLVVLHHQSCAVVLTSLTLPLPQAWPALLAS